MSEINSIQERILKSNSYCSITSLNHSLKKVFVDPFIDALKALHWATEKDDSTTKLIEFKRFVNEFGTHYASTSEMGTKLRLLLVTN